MNYLLTGGHSGIGLELTKVLLKEGHQIGLIVRNEKRKQETLPELSNPDQVDFFFADLSLPDAVQKVADDVMAKWDHLDGLFNNAGLLAGEANYSVRGNEMQLEINALAAYELTLALKPLLKKALKPFVVNTGTGGMHKQKKKALSELKKPKKFVKLLGSYINSKMAMVMMMNFLAKISPELRVISVDPGPNQTKMTKGSGMPAWLKPLSKLFFPQPIKGAMKIYRGVFDAKFQGKSGIYITGDKIKAIKITLNDIEIAELLA